MADKETALRIGRFTIRRRLGRGGMGAVYEGYDPALDRRVAIKTLTTDAISDPASRSRFEREAKAAAKLQHPNIVTIYELGNFGGKEKPYIVMEYLEGTDVTSLIGPQGLPLAEALEITTQLCRALDFAHKKGVIHRDVKPSNLRYLDNGQVKIMDFGIARVEGSDQITRSGVMIGTVHYMSPEQIRGQKLDGRADIFSAGCILYELLTGVRPFPGESATSVLYNIVNEKPKPLLQRNSELPQEIEGLLERALAKRPEDRFASAGDMARELEKILTVYRKTLPRTTMALQRKLDELESLGREQKWNDVLAKARALEEQHPELDEARRYHRRALRELHQQELERTQTPGQTQHLDEIYQEITELYGTDAATVMGPSQLGETELAPKTTAGVSDRRRFAQAGALPNGKSSSAVRALAAPIWALVFVVLLGTGGLLYWLIAAEPPGPEPVTHSLRVYSEPAGASLLLDGEPTGLRTGEDGVELVVSGMPNETHVVELRLEGHESQSREFTLRERPPAPLRLALAPKARIFELSTAPPGAEVQLDGAALDGVTPLEIELSPTGEHEITLSKADFQTRTIRLAAGEPLPEEPIALTPLGRPGALRVEASYPVAIYLGDRVLARASTNPSVQLRPGSYRVRLVAPEVFLNRTEEVAIREGETSILQAPGLGRVNVRANPGNCAVTINGIAAGAPPFMNRQIAAGTHEFVFNWPGGRQDVQSVEVQAGRPTYVIGQRR